ncbi:hypothetical protein F2Q68_00006275 [Brassica cretica]|uniref:Uncharacterized protein n=1 Tax=Brassica cretica TaxID=69181 RepID=A0A8S9JG75_BRACR|nr:hypothetical protein F2Q68_00006275 [Brassica cretica]
MGCSARALFLATSKAKADLVHAQQYQKQQGISTGILIRSCKFGTHDPYGSALPIDREKHFCVARFCSTTVDPDTSSVDRFSLTPIDPQHKPSIDRYPSPDIDRHSISDIDRYRTARHGCAFDTCSGQQRRPA